MALTLARGLRARGHEIFVVASGWTDGEFEKRLDAAVIPHRKIYLGKISKSFRPKALLWTLDALRQLPGARRALANHLRVFRPDVVIAYNRDWVLLAADILKKQRTVFHAHELPLNSRGSRAAYRILNKSARMIVAASEYVAARLRELGVTPEQVTVIYNGLDAADQTETTDHLVGVPPAIGIIGQVAPWKGYDDLVDALALLKRSGRSFQCVAFGNGEEEYMRSLKQRAERLGVLDLISWHGYISDSAEAFRHMDICVVPSRVEEAFGLVAVEAALRRIPVVAARSGALSEIVIDGETGFLTNPADPGALASRLNELLADSDLRSRLGDSARAAAIDRFRASRMTDAFERLCVGLATS